MADLIDRQAAIDKFEPWLKVQGYSEGELNMLKAVLYELRLFPSAQPEQRWIPVTERVPEAKKEVLVTTEGDFLFFANYDKVGRKMGWFESVECYELDVIAWQPLPEPYKEES